MRESSYPLFCHLKILPIQHLFVYKVLRLFYIRSGNIGTFELVYSARRNFQNTFRIPKVNRSSFRQSFSYLGPKYFNKLPLEIKLCNSFNSFDKSLKIWLFSLEDTDFLNSILV